MKPRTAKSMELYDILLRRGYPEPFCDEITKNLNTDWTAQRMIGYLSHYKKLPMEEIADEMLAILSDRNRIIQKHELEETNARWNGYLNSHSSPVSPVGSGRPSLSIIRASMPSKGLPIAVMPL